MVTRIYLQDFQSEQEMLVTGSAHHHLSRVLRKRPGDHVCLFDGLGRFANAVILGISKKETRVEVASSEREPSARLRPIHLCQAMSKGERFEFALQKSVELGVSEITPMMTERCDVRLDEARLEKKQIRWQQIIISACEQSGQNFLPKLNPVVSLKHFLESRAIDSKSNGLILSPNGQSLNQLGVDQEHEDKEFFGFDVWVGPEGGFTDEEVMLANQAGIQSWKLGPRILRTETAGLAALSVLQFVSGVF